MDLLAVLELIGEWAGTMKFFPSDSDARIGIARKIGEMAATEDQVRWIVDRLADLFTEWPGMLEVRAVFCTRFKPRDGVEAALGSGSPAFAALCVADEDERARIAAPRTLRLTGEVAPVSADTEMRDLVQRAGKPLRAPVRAATQADIDAIKAVQEQNRLSSQGAQAGATPQARPEVSR